MENKIEIEVLYESKDYWRSYLSYYLSFHNIFVFFLSFAIYGMFIAFLFLRKYVEFPHLVDVALFAFFFAIFFGLVLSYISVGYAKRLDEGKCRFVFSDENVKINTKSGTIQLDWTHFVNVKERGKYFVFSLKNGQTTLLPKRFFRDYEQVAEFKNLLRSKLGEEAYFKKSKEKLGLR